MYICTSSVWCHPAARNTANRKRSTFTWDPTLSASRAIDHMGKFPHDKIFAFFVSLNFSFAWPLWPNLICYACFFIVLWRAWLSNYTCSAPTLHQFITMHCNAFKMHCFAALQQRIFGECILVKWWGVEAEQV